jgi:hypothetical protein
MTRKGGGRPHEHGAFGSGYDDDDDDYDDVEVILRREPDLEDGDTDPVSVPQVEPIGFVRNGFHVDNGQRFRPIAQFSPPAFGPTRHDHPLASPFARHQTGSGVAHARSSGNDSSARHQLGGDEPPRNTHDRADPEDPASGRRSS